jgi:SSS family solute:Na+ symporter
LEALGFTSEFTRGDKIIYLLKLGWVAFFFGVFALFTIWNLIRPWSNEAWARWWLVNIWIGGTVGAAATVWFLIGGVFDIRAMFRQLASLQRDASDDGTVGVDLGEAGGGDAAVMVSERAVDQEVVSTPAAGFVEKA